MSTPVSFLEVLCMPRKTCLLLIAIAALLLSSCAFAAEETIDPGDKVKVTVLGAEDVSGVFSVAADGSITMPVGGASKVGGKTTDEAAAQLKSALARYVKEPQIRVELQKSPWYVTIAGRVKKPGGYAISSHTTLLELLGVAGGEDTNANLGAINVVRASSKDPLTINLQSFIDGKDIKGNPVLANGDIIMVPEKVTTLGVVFVLGEVKRLGGIELRQGMRIHEAISEAGGVTPEADLFGASITGKDGTKQDFDLMKALAQDPKEDRVLTPGDTIYLRTNSGTFNIYGSVVRPGSYPIKQKIPLTDALAMAGGYTGQAKIKDARILRSAQGGASIPVNIAMVERKQAENMDVLPGDTIIVPQRGEKASIWQILSGLGALGWLVW